MSPKSKINKFYGIVTNLKEFYGTLRKPTYETIRNLKVTYETLKNLDDLLKRKVKVITRDTIGFAWHLKIYSGNATFKTTLLYIDYQWDPHKDERC